jgi:hypothetical protein
MCVYVHHKTCTKIFIVELFLIAQTGDIAKAMRLNELSLYRTIKFYRYPGSLTKCWKEMCVCVYLKSKPNISMTLEIR